MILELIHEPSPKITPPWEQQVLHISQSSFLLSLPYIWSLSYGQEKNFSDLLPDKK